MVRWDLNPGRRIVGADKTTGQWWPPVSVDRWSDGQLAHLLLRRSKLKSRLSQSTVFMKMRESCYLKRTKWAKKMPQKLAHNIGTASKFSKIVKVQTVKPDLTKFRHFDKILIFGNWSDGLFSFWQNTEYTLVIFMLLGQILTIF